MTLEHLRQSLLTVLQTGRIGSPVSLRLHLQLSDAQYDSNAALASLMPLCKAVFHSTPAGLSARRDSGQTQLNAMVSFSGGETLLVSVGQGFSEETRLDLLLIGNHGVVRLEGNDPLENLPAVDVDQVQQWSAAVDRSLKERRQIVLSK